MQRLSAKVKRRKKKKKNNTHDYWAVYPFKPLSHWTATVLRQLAADIASGS